MKQLFRIILVVLFGFGFQPLARASTLKLEASNVFEKSVTQLLRLSKERGEIELEVGELVEDDGPAAGHSYQKPKNQEVVTPDTWIKKDLLISNPHARAAFLVVLSEDPFEALINGSRRKRCSCTSCGRRMRPSRKCFR